MFLTTHYMEEAEALADHAAIIVNGEIKAAGTPADLVAELGGATELSFELPPDVDSSSLAAIGARVDDRRVTLTTTAPEEALELLQTWSKARGVKLEALEIHRATLEDVFLEVTDESAA